MATQHFTKQQIDEIERALTSRSRKDTEFQRAENIDGTELLPVVKDGMNKVTPSYVYQSIIFTRRRY